MVWFSLAFLTIRGELSKVPSNVWPSFPVQAYGKDFQHWIIQRWKNTTRHRNADAGSVEERHNAMMLRTWRRGVQQMATRHKWQRGTSHAESAEDRTARWGNETQMTTRNIARSQHPGLDSEARQWDTNGDEERPWRQITDDEAQMERRAVTMNSQTSKKEPPSHEKRSENHRQLIGKTSVLLTVTITKMPHMDIAPLKFPKNKINCAWFFAYFN